MWGFAPCKFGLVSPLQVHHAASVVCTYLSAEDSNLSDSSGTVRVTLLRLAAPFRALFSNYLGLKGQRAFQLPQILLEHHLVLRCRSRRRKGDHWALQLVSDVPPPSFSFCLYTFSQLWGDKAGFSGSAGQDANGNNDDDDDSDDGFAMLRAAKRTRVRTPA